MENALHLLTLTLCADMTSLTLSVAFKIYIRTPGFSLLLISLSVCVCLSLLPPSLPTYRLVTPSSKLQFLVYSQSMMRNSLLGTANLEVNDIINQHGASGEPCHLFIEHIYVVLAIFQNYLFIKHLYVVLETEAIF